MKHHAVLKKQTHTIRCQNESVPRMSRTTSRLVCRTLSSYVIELPTVICSFSTQQVINISGLSGSESSESAGSLRTGSKQIQQAESNSMGRTSVPTAVIPLALTSPHQLRVWCQRGAQAGDLRENTSGLSWTRCRHMLVRVRMWSSCPTALLVLGSEINC